MQPSNDLAARLEREAETDEWNAADIATYAAKYQDQGAAGEAEYCERAIRYHRQHASDLRAAAAAVRALDVAEEALTKNGLFIKYASMVLEPKHIGFEQFPCQECAVMHTAINERALAAIAAAKKGGGE